jgi:hypothetical protein
MQPQRITNPPHPTYLMRGQRVIILVYRTANGARLFLAFMLYYRFGKVTGSLPCLPCSPNDMSRVTRRQYVVALRGNRKVVVALTAR